MNHSLPQTDWWIPLKQHWQANVTRLYEHLQCPVIPRMAHFCVSFPLQDNPSIRYLKKKFMTSYGPSLPQDRNALFLQLASNTMALSSSCTLVTMQEVWLGDIFLVLHLHSDAGNSPEAEMKGALPGNCFQEKMGWDCYQHLHSEIIETKGNTRFTTKLEETQDRQQHRLDNVVLTSRCPHTDFSSL